MESLKVVSIVILIVVAVMLLRVFLGPSEGSVKNSVAISGDKTSRSTEPADVSSVTLTREISLAERISLPLTGSVPSENVKHSIPIEEIRRGCFRQDCIPSVDEPVFMDISEANGILPTDTVGIALSYKGVDRFYPFNMLVTREIVNDVVANDPLLVTYCPLCGTGIVFDRNIDGKEYEFGVSGMLWQSNLLMYNRAASINEQNLWSQVLGEAVVGEKAGTKLSIVPSNIVLYTDWREVYTGGNVLNTGRIGDPYDGQYYEVARNFTPNFDEENSPLDPSAYVVGIEIEGVFRAYSRLDLPVGRISDSLNGVSFTITKSDAGEVVVTSDNGAVIPTVSGFWFSWVAAHPETTLWQHN